MQYNIRFAGREQEAVRVECTNLDAARGIAIQRLGGYLLDHPGFASDGHWRVEVENDVGQIVSTVIIATVTPRRPAGND